MGWASGEDVYLDPDVAYAVANRLASEQGESLRVGPKTLWRRLAEQRLLKSTDAKRRKNLVRRTIGDRRTLVLHFDASRLLGTHKGSGPSGPKGPTRPR